MRLFHCVNTRSFRVLWTLEELGLCYDFVNMDFPPSECFQGYSVVNSLGTVPALMDGNIVLTESSAACVYLSAQYGGERLTLSASEPDFAFYVDWLFAGEATLTHPGVLLHRLRKKDDIESNALKDSQIRRLELVLNKLDMHLNGRLFLAGDRLTIADIVVHFGVVLAQSLGVNGATNGNRQRWLDHVQSLPSFQLAKAVELADSAAMFP